NPDVPIGGPVAIASSIPHIVDSSFTPVVLYAVGPFRVRDIRGLEELPAPDHFSVHRIQISGTDEIARTFILDVEKNSEGTDVLLAYPLTVLLGRVAIPRFELSQTLGQVCSQPFDCMRHASRSGWKFIWISNGACGQFEGISTVHRSVGSCKAVACRTDHD